MIVTPTADLLTNELTITESQVASKRTELINLIFGQSTLPSDTITPSGDNYDYTIDMSVNGTQYTMRSAFTAATGTANGKLVIIAHGHDANADVSVRDVDFAEYTAGGAQQGDLLDLGYDVIEVFMTGIKTDVAGDGDVNQPFGSASGSPYHDSHYVALGSQFWRFMLEHIVAVVNTLEISYDNIIMMGKSGGGTLSVIMAAIDPRISMSVPICGTCPRATARNYGWSDGSVDWRGDAEQYQGIYEVATRMDLYLMGCDGGRIQKQYLNSNDTVEPFGYAAAYVSDWQSVIQAATTGTFTATSVAGAAAHEVPGEIWATLSPALAAL